MTSVIDRLVLSLSRELFVSVLEFGDKRWDDNRLKAVDASKSC